MTERWKYLDADGLPIKHNQRYLVNGVKGVIQWNRNLRAYVFRSPLGMQHLRFKKSGERTSTLDAKRVE